MNENLCRFRPPKFGMRLIWEITNLCNLSCLHCCNSSGPNVDISKEVATEKAISIAREIDKNNIREVLISGGEPLVRKDIYEIISNINWEKVDILLATNAILVTKDCANKLSKLHLKKITVSLDGHNPETNGGVRNSDSFYKIIEGIKNLVELDLPVRVSTVIHKKNKDYIFDIVKLIDSLGVKSLSIHTILTVGRAKINDLSLTTDDKNEALAQLEKAQKEFPNVIIDHSFSEKNKTTLAPKGCCAGTKIVHITANGDVSPCSWLYKINREYFTFGNINEISLEQSFTRRNEIMFPLKKLSKNCPVYKVKKYLDTQKF